MLMDIEAPMDSKDECFFIIRFGELGLKSRAVKNRFLKLLSTNIEDRFLHADLDCFIKRDQGRLYVYPGDFEKGAGIISTTFGIVSFSPAISVKTSDLDEINEKAVEYSRWLLREADSFAVRTRRVGNQQYTSQDVNVMVGAEIIRTNEKKDLKVDLTSPDKTLHIEIRDNTTYLYHRKIKGPGGLPYGASGCSVCAVGDRGSLLAAYLMMKRGNRLRLFYTPRVYPKPLDYESVVGFFSKYIPAAVIEQLPNANAEDILAVLDERAGEQKIDGLVLGFDLETVMENINSGHIHSTERPALYPVIGFSRDEIAERYDTVSF